MKKSISLLFLIALFLMLPSFSCKAMKPWEFSSRDECDKFELALAKSDGGLEHKECYDSYDSALNAMNNGDDNSVIIENGVIINAKYAVVDYDVSYTYANKAYIDVYNSSTSWDTEGHYIRTSQPDDAVVLDYSYSSNRIKIKVSGLVGWISKTGGSATLYDVVPLAWVKSPQYYKVTSDAIYHVFPGNVYGEKGNYVMSLDIKPSMLNEGNYYSYDGHYFYKDMKTLINDYKNNTYANSVNPTQPYYNYYQYLSYRTKTIYNADNINQFIDKRTGGNTSSKLYNTGEAFINAQNDYGINALLMLSVGINESGWGTSNISQSKNNLFGLNAVDSNPYLQSDAFNSPADCIETYAYVWLSYGFVQPGDWRFKGANLGNKVEGLNLKYASDPYWGENAAHYYYEFDKTFDFQERKQNEYTIAVLKDNYSEGVNVRKTPNGDIIDNENGDGNRYYKYKIVDSAVVVLGEEKDNNGKIWYKIQSDPNLTDNLSYTKEDSKSTPKKKYNWNGHVYVSADYFRKVTETVTEYPSNDPNGNSSPTPIVATISSTVNKTDYSYESGMITGIKLDTNADSVADSLKNKGAKDIKVTDSDGNSKSGKLATGDKITLTVEDKTETIIVVVAGDTDGDGAMSAVDYVNIKNHIMETHSLNGAYLKAADADNDGSISAMDYVKIKNYIMGG